MKQTERASIFRIVSDLIKADAIIDTREMEKLDSIRDKYAIKKRGRGTWFFLHIVKSGTYLIGFSKVLAT